MGTPSVIVDDSAQENGLATMLAELLRQNMEQTPAKTRHFDKLKAVVAISAPDAEVSLTMFFNRGSCVIYDGLVGKPDLHIEADSETILGLSTVPLRAGLPDLFDRQGRDLARKILSKKLRIQGLLFHPLALVHVTNLFSVN